MEKSGNHWWMCRLIEIDVVKRHKPPLTNQPSLVVTQTTSCCFPTGQPEMNDDTDLCTLSLWVTGEFNNSNQRLIREFVMSSTTGLWCAAGGREVKGQILPLGLIATTFTITTVYIVYTVHNMQFSVYIHKYILTVYISIGFNAITLWWLKKSLY